MRLLKILHSFIRKTSDHVLFIPTIYNLDVVNDEQIVKHPTMQISMNATPKPNNNLVTLLLYFDILDSIIDSKNQNLYGEKFSIKYIKMERNDPYDIILGEIFRLLLILRNAFMHNKKIIGDTLNIKYERNYTNKTVQYKLTFKDNTLGYLLTLSELLYIVFEEKSNYYLYILYGLYLIFLKHNVEFSDNFGNILKNINPKFSFYTSQRYHYKTDYLKKNNKLLINLYDKTNILFANEIGIDYCINFDNKRYTIPEEYLKNGSILLKELNIWEENE